MDDGFEIMHEVAPTKEEEHMIVPSEHLDMFSNMDKDGYSIIHGMLQELGVDTIVTGRATLTRTRTVSTDSAYVCVCSGCMDGRVHPCHGALGLSEGLRLDCALGRCR